MSNEKVELLNTFAEDIRKNREHRLLRVRIRKNKKSRTTPF